MSIIRSNYRDFADSLPDIERFYKLCIYDKLYVRDRFEPYGAVSDRKKNLIEYRFVYEGFVPLKTSEREYIEDSLYCFIKKNFNKESEIHCTKNKCYIRMEVEQ